MTSFNPRIKNFSIEFVKSTTSSLGLQASIICRRRRRVHFSCGHHFSLRIARFLLASVVNDVKMSFSPQRSWRFTTPSHHQDCIHLTVINTTSPSSARFGSFRLLRPHLAVGAIPRPPRLVSSSRCYRRLEFESSARIRRNNIFCRSSIFVVSLLDI